MGRKREITGKAVIYTVDGVKVIDAEVRRYANAHGDEVDSYFDCEEPYLYIGGARTVPTDDIFAKPAYHPERIEHAAQFATTKFFRLILDLQRLAQWDPIDSRNYAFDGLQYRTNQPQTSRFETDADLYSKWKFSPAMIKFTEERYQ